MLKSNTRVFQAGQFRDSPIYDHANSFFKSNKSRQQSIQFTNRANKLDPDFQRFRSCVALDTKKITCEISLLRGFKYKQHDFKEQLALSLLFP